MDDASDAETSDQRPGSETDVGRADTKPVSAPPPDTTTSEPARPDDAVEPPPTGFLSPLPTRRAAESVFVRVIATAGVIAVGTALGAVLVANNLAGWIVGLAVSAVSVVFAAILWRSSQL
jgi:hypothetical protein